MVSVVGGFVVVVGMVTAALVVAVAGVVVLDAELVV